MKVYLAGPMRGYDRFNFPAFHAAAERLRGFGYEVDSSPAEHDNAEGFEEERNSLDGFDLVAAFRWDVDQVFACDAIVALPGWRGSQGAGLEVGIAHLIGTPVFEYAEIGNPTILLPQPVTP